MGKILITPRSLTQHGHPALDSLKRQGHELIFSTPGKQPDEAELMKLLPGCIGMLAGVEKISAEVLEAAKSLKAISRNGTGIDNIDLEAAKRLNIKIIRAEGANSRGVAELALALMFCLIRGIPSSHAQLKNGAWSRKQGFETPGKILGIIGSGHIGKIVARLALALGMQVKAFDIVKDSSMESLKGFEYASEDQVFSGSDVITLHCPMPENGRPIITKETISKMKKGVYLINTARGGLVNDDAVLEALNSSHIAGYATDVFEKEPPVLCDLHKHENVILTPHIGGYTFESVEHATHAAVENLIKALQ
jgi:D-3-phosphoglycerate dehydrogenase